MTEAVAGMLPMASACRGNRCLVVGSAPGATLPDADDYDTVIGANGGASLYRHRVEVLATTSHLFRRGAVAKTEAATRQLLRGLRVVWLWVDTRNGPLEVATDGLRRLGVEWSDDSAFDPPARAEVVVAAIDKDLWVSTGVWSACAAIAGGASHVAVTGVGLGLGHATMPWDASPRHHVAEDREAIGALARLGVEFIT